MIFVFGVVSIIIVYFFQSMTNTDEHNYTLLKEATEGAMIDALESGKLSSAVLDVVEGEFGRYYYDCSERDLSGEYIDILRKMDNVIFTHHMGFYYRKAVSDMVYNCLLSMKMFAEGKDIPHRLA